jgi:hypothetical protein
MGDGYLETLGFSRMKFFFTFMKKYVDIENGPWHRPSVATKKASTIKPTIAMKTVAKKTLIKLTELTEARDRLFELKKVQNEARDEELRIREYLARKLHDGVEGSKTITVDGIKVTVTRTLSRTIDRDLAEKLSKDHGDIALECLRWKPEVIVSGYRKHTELLDDFIVTKAGPPQVDFK